MLSQVAGPTTISVRVVAGAPAEVLVPTQAAALWIDGFGLLVLPAYGSTNYGAPHVVNLDGKAYFLTGRFTGASSIEGYGWDDDEEEPWINWASTHVTTRVQVPPFHVREHRPEAGLTMAPTFAELSDRRIWCQLGKVYSSTYTPGVGWSAAVVEHTLVVSDTTLQWVIASARDLIPTLPGHSLWWCMNPTTGNVYLYDATTMAEIAGRRTTFGSGFVAAAYSRKHDLFFVVRNYAGTYKLDSYADEPVAAVVVVPTFDFAPRKGAPVGVRSRVTGGLGEPCAGRFVTFTVTSGSVSPSVVETDEDGYADAEYQPPFTPDVGVQLTATLVE